MNDESLIIGGEFDIDLGRLPEKKQMDSLLQNVYRYSSGRSALYHILLDIKQRTNIRRILLPDYLCSSIVSTVQKAELDIHFFELDSQLELNEKVFNSIYQEKSIVLLINYFGLKKLSTQIEYVRSVDKEAVIIEDDVQAFYSFDGDYGQPDYQFTSLRKMFPIPDGGLVKSIYPMNEPLLSNHFHHYKLAGSVLKASRKLNLYPDEIYLNLFEQGENLIDAEMEMGMSKLSQNLFRRTDFTFVSNIRKRNAETLISGLKQLNIQQILPMEETDTPLFIPVWLDNRDKVRKSLFQNNIFLPIHWPLNGLELKKGLEMAEHELSIVIDQRYTVDDMNYLLSLMEEAVK